MTEIARAVSEYVTRERKQSETLWPSSTGGCMRKEMLRYHGHDRTHSHDNKTLWDFMRFGWYENPINAALKHDDKFVNVETQVEVGNDWWHGYIDMVVDNNWIIEIKSRSPYGKVGDLPYEHHLPQVWTYYELLADKLGLVAPSPALSATLVYIDRWTDKVPTIREFEVTPTEEELDAHVALMTEFENWASKAEELPPVPREYPEDHPWECMIGLYNRKTRQRDPTIRCEFFGQCWPDRVDSSGNLKEDPKVLPF